MLPGSMTSSGTLPGPPGGPTGPPRRSWRSSRLAPLDLLGGPDGLSGWSSGTSRVTPGWGVTKWYQSFSTAGRNLVEWSVVKISKLILQQEK